MLELEATVRAPADRVEIRDSFLSALFAAEILFFSMALLAAVPALDRFLPSRLSSLSWFRLTVSAPSCSPSLGSSSNCSLLPLGRSQSAEVGPVPIARICGNLGLLWANWEIFAKFNPIAL